MNDTFKGLIEGRIVHYVMPNGRHLPAIVVNVWGESGVSNLQVITDGTNDLPYTQDDKEKFSNFGIVLDEVAHGHIWKTSIAFSENKETNTWHWPERI